MPDRSVEIQVEESVKGANHNAVTGESSCVYGQADICSAAYLDALRACGKNIARPNLQDFSPQEHRLDKLTVNLQEISNRYTDKSSFRRHLEKFTVPLGYIDHALDVTSLVVMFEPGASTAVGFMKGVTTVSTIIRCCSNAVVLISASLLLLSAEPTRN